MLVVAAAMVDAQGRVLLQRRRGDVEHGGLWEFPGGKVEEGETPENALIREIGEELAITLDSDGLRPLAFASNGLDSPEAPLVILLYMCAGWTGPPRCLDAEAIAWFAPEELEGLAMPPLDYPLARAFVSSI
jgi:8-oxo-dGTP diphosphatase